MDEQHRQETALAGTTDRDRLAALRDNQRTQRLELDHRNPPS